MLQHSDDFKSRFIAESPSKINDIYLYYAAFYGLNDFPFKKCNAPWVSTVIEADGSVKPCFFHETIRNIRDSSLTEILNSKQALSFRKSLSMETNPTCVKCVCALNLSPLTKIG
jgi:MoaA/NifB/PqqE/SkfB family radical SAM enzyme